MSDKPKPKSERSGRRGDPVSLAPLTLDQALGAALQVKRAEVDKLETEQKAKKATKKPAPKK